MKHIISICVFLVLAITVWWSITKNFSDSDNTKKITSSDYAQVFMSKFQMTSMNKQGKPSYILNGSYLQRANDSDDTKVQKPVFQLFQDNKHWVISAEDAIINDKKETIQLKKDVLMKQKNMEPGVTIRTQYLLINTKTQVARTNVAVDIKHGKSHLTSNGMVFNNTTNELELSSDVNAQYLPL